MEKDTALSKNKLTKVLVVFCSLLLLFVAVLIGYSFFSIKNEKQNLKTVIDLSNDQLAKKVPSGSITKEGKYIYYKFPVVFYEVSSEEGKYVIRGMAQNFQEYFESIENAKFIYELEKSKGSFDFTTIEYLQPVYIVTQYRVDNDFRYLREYSVCTLKSLFSDNDECVINRDITKWSIEIIK